MSDNPSFTRFRQAQDRLNIVKAHAHEIVGVKREQVHMVVESFSRPGTYEITIHQDGKVRTESWTPPVFEDAFVPVQPEPEPEFSPLVLPEPEEPVAEEDTEDEEEEVEEEVPVTVEEKLEEKPEENLTKTDLGAAEDTPVAPEPTAAPKPAARRRGRPKKSV